MLLLDERKRVREIYKEFSVATALARWQHHDAREIELALRLLLLRKVTYHVEAISLPLTQDVEIELLNFLLKVFVVEEKARDIA